MPILAVFGDHRDTPTGIPALPTWQVRFEICQALIGRMKSAGGQAEMLDPAERGIRGNSHMIMQDKNHLQIADLILKWIDERVAQALNGARSDGRQTPTSPARSSSLPAPAAASGRRRHAIWPTVAQRWSWALGALIASRRWSMRSPERAARPHRASTDVTDAAQVQALVDSAVETVRPRRCDPQQRGRDAAFAARAAED